MIITKNWIIIFQSTEIIDIDGVCKRYKIISIYFQMTTLYENKIEMTYMINQ